VRAPTPAPPAKPIIFVVDDDSHVRDGIRERARGRRPDVEDYEIPSAARPRRGQAYRRRRKTKGGIIIPDTAKEKPQEGEIIAVGPGGRDEAGKLIPIDVKVGDRVLFGKWSGTEVKLDGEELLIMKESDIMGVLEGAAKEGRFAEEAA
jgi:chaperonin GroES